MAEDDLTIAGRNYEDKFFGQSISSLEDEVFQAANGFDLPWRPIRSMGGAP
jgi:hypothetical protein